MKQDEQFTDMYPPGENYNPAPPECFGCVEYKRQAKYWKTSYFELVEKINAEREEAETA